MAKLSDSVAPDVHTISLESAFTRFATCSLAFSTASSAFQPNSWDLDAGLPKVPSIKRQSCILAATLGSTGQVAA